LKKRQVRQFQVFFDPQINLEDLFRQLRGGKKPMTILDARLSTLDAPLELRRWQLELFTKCRRAFFCSIKRPNTGHADSVEAARGRFVHSGMSRYLKHLQETQRQTDFEALQGIVQEVIAEEGLSEEGEELFLECAGDTVLFPMPPPGAIILSDREDFFIKLAQGKVIVGIRPDWGMISNNEAFITDWKTNWQLESQAQVEKDFQLRFYGTVIFDNFLAVEIVRLSKFFMRHLIVRSFTFLRSDGIKFRARLEGLAEAILAETEWTPTPGAQCTYCQHAEDCPVRSQFAIGSVEDAEKTAGEILILKQRIKEREAALKQHCNEHGKIIVNGMEFGYFVSRTPEYDPMDFLNIFSGDHPEELKAIKVDGTQAKRLAKKYPEQMEECKTGEKITTRFAARKAGEEEE
jgi:hypothetical protein